MWFRSLFDTLLARSSHRLSRKRHPAPSIRQCSRSFRPLLEILEDRTLPSTLTVTNNSDTGVVGDGSLRGEIAAADSGDTINFVPSLAGQTITLTHGELAITKSLDLEGLGANQLTISGNNQSRVFDITASNASVTITGLTISDGLNSDGSGITNLGTLTVNYCTLSGNVAYYYDAYSSNDGGAVENFGTLTINNSTISGNKAVGRPGFDARTSITTGSGGVGGGYIPAANGMGGGIYMAGGALSINFSTIADNEASGGSSAGLGLSAIPGNGIGGGLYIAGGTATINNSTLAANQAIGGNPYGAGGGGIATYTYSGPSTPRMYDTILADNTADYGPDLYGGVTSLGHNLIGNTSSGSGFAANDLVNVDPQLGKLQNNGGPTQTMALLPGSPAINAGDNSNAPTYDQRGPGFPRIVGGFIDIGAFEFQNANTTAAASTFTITGFPSPASSGTAGIFTVTAYDANGNIATGYNGTIHFSSSDPLAILPADATLNNGSGQFSATLETAGYQSITATDSQNSTLTGSQTGIQILPFASITGPFAGYPTQTLKYTLGASGDPAGTNYTFAVNWGDGSAVQTVTGPSGATVNHSFATSGEYSIRVTATDPGGLTSKPAYQSVNILPVSVTIETDPANTNRQMLVIDGTANNDSIVLAGNSNDVSLSFDGTPLGDIMPTNGNPFALVMVFGEGGNDILDARSLALSSVLVGGADNDTLYGGSAPNLLIGGGGADTLYAGSAGDILISGYTSYDNNPTALAFIMAEWDSTDSYTTRINKISNGRGLNGSYVLNSTTVFNDNAIDDLYGGAGMDWFFAHKKGKGADKVYGQTGGEVITSI